MQTFFKFIKNGNPHAINSILSGTVKFTPIHELNDPAELCPVFNQQLVDESHKRLCRDGYTDEDMINLGRQNMLLQRLLPEYPQIPMPTKDEATQLIRLVALALKERLELQLKETADNIASKIGIFCLSERYDSLPMWAHYADIARGFAIEYKDLGCVFQGDGTKVLQQLRQVTYEPKLSGVTFDTNSHEKLFFSKFSDWSYENEVRVILPLAECKQSISDGNPLYLFDLPSQCVGRIILGWNMPKHTQENIKNTVQQINPDVNVAYAEFTSGKVHLVPA